MLTDDIYPSRGIKKSRFSAIGENAIKFTAQFIRIHKNPPIFVIPGLTQVAWVSSKRVFVCDQPGIPTVLVKDGGSQVEPGMTRVLVLL